MNPCGLFSAVDERPRKSFCGVTAIAAITGETVQAVEQTVLRHRAKVKPPRRHRLRGAVVSTMWWDEMAPVLALLGWRPAEASEYFRRPWQPCPTFAQWQRRTGRGRGGPYLLLVTGHFVAVAGSAFVDSTQRDPIPLRKAPWRRKRVKAAMRLERIG